MGKKEEEVKDNSQIFSQETEWLENLFIVIENHEEVYLEIMKMYKYKFSHTEFHLPVGHLSGASRSESQETSQCWDMCLQIANAHAIKRSRLVKVMCLIELLE